MTAAVIRPKFARRRACDRFIASTPGSHFCVCTFGFHAHPPLIACSSCGEDFLRVVGDDKNGMSHCKSHAGREPVQ